MPKSVLGRRRRIDLSLVVVSFEMARALPRTLLSLSRHYQRGVSAVDYEIVLVDNGSTSPATVPVDLGVPVVELVGPGTVSPAGAANAGIAAARGAQICVILDGARMVSPGVVAAAMRAARAYPRAISTPIALHLGSKHQSISRNEGYGPDVEDRALASIGWPADGYRLFDIACLAGSNPDGWFGSINESCCLAMPREIWNELRGYDEDFREAGGGLVSLDLFERALALRGVTPLVLLGEGSFHQIHGGASSNAIVDPWPAFSAEYERIRGRPYARPSFDPVYIGKLSPAARRFIGASGT